jgi:hypothetical protein
MHFFDLLLCQIVLPSPLCLLLFIHLFQLLLSLLCDNYLSIR